MKQSSLFSRSMDMSSENICWGAIFTWTWDFIVFIARYMTNRFEVVSKLDDLANREFNSLVSIRQGECLMATCAHSSIQFLIVGNNKFVIHTWHTWGPHMGIQEPEGQELGTDPRYFFNFEGYIPSLSATFRGSSVQPSLRASARPQSVLGASCRLPFWRT